MRAKLVYISGGDNFAPADVKAALDDIRRSLGLPADMVLFGLPVDSLAAEAADHKVLRLPQSSKKSILNVISASGPDQLVQAAPTIADEPLVVSDDEPDEFAPDDFAPDAGRPAESGSITELLGKLPPLGEEPPPPGSLADEFADFLDKEEKPDQKKAKPFVRKKKPFNNLLGDLFSYAGMAANDDSQGFQLPDFIKRP
jgi:hypothetical protein